MGLLMNNNSVSTSSLPPHHNAAQPEPAPEQKKVGRPSSFTPELGATICEEPSGTRWPTAGGPKGSAGGRWQITNSCKSLRAICAEVGISRSMLFRWLRANDQFRAAYQHAKECQADFINDEIIEIADDASHDTMKGPGGRLVANPNAIHRSKLRIEARKHEAQRLQAQKYLRKTNAHLPA